MQSDRETWSTLVVSFLPHLSSKHFDFLIQHFGSAHEAVKAGPTQWKNDDLFGEEHIRHLLLRWENAKFCATKEVEEAKRRRISLLLLPEAAYPYLLKQISTPPIVLYVAGEPDLSAQNTLALVGSRNASHYGEKVARLLSREIARAGIITVSGLARGIDKVVHEATLEEGGKTWAVLGCGLAQCYPPENKKLMEKIQEKGCVISEFPIETPPLARNFPQRNRIIAGLSTGTVLIEGAAASGALITARIAANEGRDVYAVPGPITSPLSAAPHMLIRQGAKLVHEIQDIFDEWPESTKEKIFKERVQKDEGIKKISSRQLEIMNLLSDVPLAREKISTILQCPMKELLVFLMQLELERNIRVLPGGFVVKN